VSDVLLVVGRKVSGIENLLKANNASTETRSCFNARDGLLYIRRGIHCDARLDETDANRILL
jgi:hypothetical protein